MKKYNFISIVLVLCLLISSMGTLSVFASETSVSGPSYTSDFNDPKWQQGTALSAAEFKTKHDYINTTSTQAIDWCTFTVDKAAGDDDYAVTIRTLQAINPNLNMVLDEAGEVDYGVYVIDYDIKEPTVNMDGMVSRVITPESSNYFLFAFRKNTSNNKMQLMKTDSVSSSKYNNGYAVADGGYANEEGWFRMRVVLSKNEGAGWTADVYNLDYSEETSIISHNIPNAGTIKYFRMYTPSQKDVEMTVKNISVKHTRAQIRRLSYKSDFENSEIWEDDKEYSPAEFNTKHKYFTSNFTDAGTDRQSFTVKNGALTLKSKVSAANCLIMNMNGVSDGVLVIDYDMYEPSIDLDGMVSRVGVPDDSDNYLFAFRKNTTENKMQLIKTDHVDTNKYGNVEGNAVVDGGFANEEGWFRLRVVLSKNAGDGWTADVYNRDYSLTKSIISHDIPNASAINWFRMYASTNGASEITLKNISVKHTTLFGGFEAHRDGDTVEYEAVIKTDMNEGAVIIAALYQGDELINSQTRNLADIEDGKIDFDSFDLQGRNYDNLTAKFMMWDSLEGLTPLDTSVEMEVLENTPEDTPAE